MKVTAPTPKEILDHMVVNKDTAYDMQLSYTLPNGYIVSVVKSSEIATRKQLEDALVEQVTEAYDNL